MVHIYSNERNKELKIVSYNGDQKDKIFRLKSSLEKRISNQKWNFFREGDNHTYTKGDVSYKGDCRNNIVISTYPNTNLINVKNAFVSAGDSFIETFPIFNLQNAIDKGKKRLSDNEIIYHIPKSVFERENLIEKDLEELKKETMQRYDINVKSISALNLARAKKSIYILEDNNQKKYVLKFRGKNKDKVELLSLISKEISDYFPLNLRRKDSLDFTFEIGGELYGIEEFVANISPKIRNLKYFSLLGTHISSLHKRFSYFIERNKEIKEILVPKTRYTSESNLISLYLDLSKNKLEHGYLLSELDRIIKERLNNQIISLPTHLIHADLNYSNLIWNRNNPKIVDSETIKISTKLNEFESPLLFEGNMEKPKYIKKSLITIVKSYNQSSYAPLSEEEIKILPYLLRYTLLKNFVVRKIRRGIDDKDYLEETKRNLKNIDKDL